jgi:hypothetical protein
MSTAASTVRHAIGVGLEALLLVAIVAALAFGVALASGHPAGAGSVFAAKGGNGGGGQTAPYIALAAVDGLAAAATQPSLGDTVTFTVTVPSNVNNPRVELQCFQSGTIVYGETGSVDQATGDGLDPLGYNGFVLGGGGSIWLSVRGPADCTANLFYFGQHAGVQTFNVIASTNFSAGG